MRVVSHGRYNLCPSEVCNPADASAAGHCEVPETTAPPVEFYAYREVPAEAVAAAQAIVRAGGIDIGGIEYLESAGERVFYDVNANSNLRPAIARELGVEPFDRVVDYLASRVQAARSRSCS
jgi:hypothetical protein